MSETTYETREIGVRDGFKVTARVVSDDVGYVALKDACYSDVDERAYNDGEWEFVGVVVEVSRAGVVLGYGSIWGMEYGDYYPQSLTILEGEEFAYGYGPDLIQDALDKGCMTLDRITRGED